MKDDEEPSCESNVIRGMYIISTGRVTIRNTRHKYDATKIRPKKWYYLRDRYGKIYGFCVFYLHKTPKEAISYQLYKIAEDYYAKKALYFGKRAKMMKDICEDKRYDY